MPTQRPIDFTLPRDVTSTRAALANGATAYSFRHARLGLLGRLIVGAEGDHTRVISEVSGDPDDPMTARRLAIFRPISEALMAILDRRTGGERANFTTPTPQPLGPDAYHLIKSKLLQCDRCDALVAHVIYADAAAGTMEDHARLMYGRIKELGLPAWVLGPIQERGRYAGMAQLLAVYPKRERVRWVSEAEFEVLMDAITGVHCAPAQPDAIDLLPDIEHPGPGLDVTASVNLRLRRRATALPAAVRRTLGDPQRLTPETLQALLVPCAAEEAQARYRAQHGRGIIVCDNSSPGDGSTVRFWYVRPREAPGVLADTPTQLRADVVDLLTVYEARTEAILVIRLPHAIQVVHITADGTMRSSGLHRLAPRTVQ